MNVFEIVTERILERLAAGVVPWQRPWKVQGVGPTNLASKRPYAGINIWILSSAGFGSPWWLTFNQVRKLGGRIRQGEHATPVMFWKRVDRKPSGDEALDDDDPRPATYLIARFYKVFNLEQVDGIDAPATEPEPVDHNAALQRCAAIVDGYPSGPSIKWGSDRAAYSKMRDTVIMPGRSSFSTQELLYSTLFHELVHSTGHESRLGRKLASFSTDIESYSEEELLAEMGAAFLCGEAGILPATLENSAAYIAGWSKRLGEDPKLVVYAAQRAQKAVGHILGWGGGVVSSESE